MSILAGRAPTMAAPAITSRRDIPLRCCNLSRSPSQISPRSRPRQIHGGQAHAGDDSHHGDAHRSEAPGHVPARQPRGAGHHLLGEGARLVRHEPIVARGHLDPGKFPFVSGSVSGRRAGLMKLAELVRTFEPDLDAIR